MFIYVLNKLLSLLVWLRYGKLPVNIKYYYRHTYMCQLRQWRFVIRDYFIKKPYKEISFSGEFGAELMFALPFAYWHHLNGTLKNTTSSLFTKEFYFFSPDHTEKFTTRSDEGNYNFDLPRILYSQDYDMKKWVRVPLKERYKNDFFVFDKPILIIANRYNTEWDGPPVSFFSLEILDEMITTLKDKFTIIYNRPKPQHLVPDHSLTYDLKDYEWIAEHHSEIHILSEMYRDNPHNTHHFNHFQMMAYSNADHFISIHGGTATFASYFGGTNLIFSKQGPEHHFHCFTKLFPQLSGAAILHAKTEDELRAYINSHFTKN